MDEIVAVVSAHFGCDAAPWSAGQHSDDAARAVVRLFGTAVVRLGGDGRCALGYGGFSSVSRAVRRVEAGGCSGSSIG